MPTNFAFLSRSQAGQDAFVHALLPTVRGRFLDIGCGHPVEINNTFALEQLGWSGVLIDSDPNVAALALEQRTAPMFQGDARAFDWTAALVKRAPIDYASLDVDEHTHAALVNLFRHDIRPTVLTVEHDHYQRGDRLRSPNRRLLAEAGYDLLCADVHSNGCAFEDWFVAPDLVDMGRADAFRSTGLEWRAVLLKGGL